ncbi:hypothetical protein BDR05DRAFT_963578, partial [Suillus weaverae]
MINAPQMLTNNEERGLRTSYCKHSLPVSYITPQTTMIMLFVRAVKKHRFKKQAKNDKKHSDPSGSNDEHSSARRPRAQKRAQRAAANS